MSQIPGYAGMIIGLAGRKGSGKDTAALGLRSRPFHPSPFRVHSYSFAGELKDICRRLYGLSYEQVNGTQEQKERIDPRWGLSGRQILQRFGTEVARSVHPDTWVRFLFETKLRYAAAPAILVTDVRFPNEVAAIHERGGKVILIERPSLDVPSDVHASERIEDLDVDGVIQNTGTVEELQDNFRAMVFAMFPLLAERFEEGDE